MPAVQEQPIHSIPATKSLLLRQIIMAVIVMRISQKANLGEKQCLSAVLLLMNGDFMICTATYGNGVPIGMVNIKKRYKLIQKAEQMERTRYTEVAAGLTMRGSVGLLFVVVPSHGSATALLASASFPPSKQ